MPFPIDWNLVPALSVLFLLTAGYVIACFIRNVYFNPLSPYPGPLLYRGSDIPRLIQEWRGNTVHKWTELHHRYGPIVRIGPGQLSYITSTSWRDIYGSGVVSSGNGQQQPQRNAQMLKEEMQFPGEDFEFFEAKPMISCDAPNHARHRKVINYAFSDRTLRDYEPRIIEHVDLLMHRLHEQVAEGLPVDVVEWFNFTMFDISSSLTFGHPFGNLRQAKYHPWVARVFPGMKLIAWSGVVAKVPGLGTAIQWVLPKAIKAEAAVHVQTIKDLANRRMGMDAHTTRTDFMTHILPHVSDEKAGGLSTEELYLDSQLLAIAGSETTSTLLCGAVYHLCQNPGVASRLVEEIRATFATRADITIAATARMRYLMAVIYESLRIYPPGAINMPRTVQEGGAWIDGKHVPAGVEVAVAQYAAYHSPLHFRDPDDFVPERWLGDDARYADDNRDMFQPFGVGPRNCVGKNLAYTEIRLILTQLFWNFDVQALPGQENWLRQRVYLSWAKPPLQVRLHPVAR